MILQSTCFVPVASLAFQPKSLELLFFDRWDILPRSILCIRAFRSHKFSHLPQILTMRCMHLYFQKNWSLAKDSTCKKLNPLRELEPSRHLNRRMKIREESVC